MAITQNHVQGPELFLVAALGVDTAPNAKRIEEAVSRAITVFLLAYRAEASKQ